MPTKSGRRIGSPKRTKSAAQKRHQERASKAMKMFKSGRVSSLKRAWAKV